VKPLSLREIILLTRCLGALQELEAGKRAPKTSLQRRFVSVCRGALPATTEYERAYLNWRQTRCDLTVERARIENEQLRGVQRARERLRQNQRVVELKKIERQAEARLALELERQKSHAKRKAHEWGTRDDWRRDRGAWRK
jgi:Protein of unknown function, DUF